jgi:hypothetical protein
VSKVSKDTSFDKVSKDAAFDGSQVCAYESVSI